MPDNNKGENFCPAFAYILILSVGLLVYIISSFGDEASEMTD